MAASEGVEERRSKPGWSLARDSPRPKAKQGWECPAPTVQDWEDYKTWKAQQAAKEELPVGTQFYLADLSLLFYKDPDVQLPWIHRVKCELPRRLGRLSGDLPVKASYIGFAHVDADSQYETFKSAMAEIGIVLCRHIHNPPTRFEIAHLEQSDLIMVDGGDRKRLWETLGSDVGPNQVAEHVKWRYLQNAVTIAVGEATSLLGAKSWYKLRENTFIPFTGWKIFPHTVVPEAGDDDYEDVVMQLGGAGVVLLEVFSGGAMIFNKDGLLEPVKTMVQEFRWDWQSDSVKRAILIGPPRGTGLICPLYAAMKEREGDEGEAADVWAYSLTQEEEDEEERLLERFDIYDSWLSLDLLEQVDQLRQQGNDAFKTGKADLASIHYEQARVLLESSALHWSELEPKFKEELEASSQQSKDAVDSKGKRQKEDFRATTLLITLLLNMCACYLLAHEQDQKKAKQAPNSDVQSAAPASRTPCDGQGETGEECEGQAGVEVAPTMASEVLKTIAGRDQKGSFCFCLRPSLLKWHRSPCASDTSITTLEAQVVWNASVSCVPCVWLRTFAYPGSPDGVIQCALLDSCLHFVACDGGARNAHCCVFERMRDPRNALRDFEESLVRAPGDKAITKKRDEAASSAGAVAENMYYARHKELDAQQLRLQMDTRRSLVLKGSFDDEYADERREFSIGQPLARHVEGTLQETDGLPHVALPDPPVPGAGAPYLHTHALWTWEFLVQRAPKLQLLQIEDVDLGSGPLEWLCKGLRTHSEVKSLRLLGVHLGSAGAKMLRNVIAQNTSLLEVRLDSCAIHDAGLDEIAQGLRDSTGPLETLSLRRNCITSRKLGKLGDAMCEPDNGLNLTELDLSGNMLGTSGAKEVSRLIASAEHRLRIIRLQDCLVDLAAFWRLVSKLDDARQLAQLDLRCNPIGRGTRRCWRSQMGPTLRCDVMLTDHPSKAKKEAQLKDMEVDTQNYPLPGRWV